MRVWMTQNSIQASLVDLDDQRLLAQHREAVGMLRMVAGSDEQLYRFRNNSLAHPFRKHHSFLVSVHDLAVEEMKARGWQKHGHATPIIFEGYPNFKPGEPYLIPQFQISFDRNDLTERYNLHCNQVLEGKRKDMLRWTLRSIPAWISDLLASKILYQQAHLRGAPFNKPRR